MLLVGCKAEKLDDGLLRIIASTERLDREDEIVEQNFDLRSFRKNPVFLWMHRYHELPIGKVMKSMVETIDGKPALIQHVKFAPFELYPLADQIRRFYEEKFLNAFSISFKRIEARLLTEEERVKYGATRSWASIVEKSELLETSAVTIPMNPEALVAGKFFSSSEEAQSFFQKPFEKSSNVDPAKLKSFFKDVKVEEPCKVKVFFSDSNGKGFEVDVDRDLLVDAKAVSTESPIVKTITDNVIEAMKTLLPSLSSSSAAKVTQTGSDEVKSTRKSGGDQLDLDTEIDEEVDLDTLDLDDSSADELVDVLCDLQLLEHTVNVPKNEGEN